jgi:exopolysaccharide/PEP-CTERM locus tyrosine autokinase
MSNAAMSNDNRRAEAVPGSLIERAAEVYDFASALRSGPRAVRVFEEPVEELIFETVEVEEGVAPLAVAPAEAGAVAGVESASLSQPVPASAGAMPIGASPDTAHPIDRARLIEAGFILPDSPIGTLAEEFRLVKRQLLLRAGASDDAPNPKDRMILVCSAQPNEGKTFCSVNLALSLASERDNEVLLVDADVAKPEVLSILGLSGTAGLIDAIADPDADVEDFILRTDVPKLSVLPAGKAVNNDTELLSSARAANIIAGLATANERRIVIIDSAPALAASPAGVLAHRVGRVLMVVRADRTSEAELREAIALLDGCSDISLLLNAVSFFGTNRTYGSYYGRDS